MRLSPLDLTRTFLAYAGPVTADPHIVLKIETKQPIELSDFVGTFVGLGSQYERFHDEAHPDERGEARFYVREVRAGSIIATLIAVAEASPLLGATFAGIKHANDLYAFVDKFGGSLKRYFTRGGRDPDATKGDLADWLRTVQAVAHDPDGSLQLAVYEHGKQRAAFAFGTQEARQAAEGLLDHRAELEAKTAADYERVLLRFVRPSTESGKPGRKGGERAIIEKISSSARSVVYASDLAEQKMKHELREAEGNVFKLLFDVDVNVEQSAAGKPLAYRITAVHSVVEADEDPELL
jgi:hypothetical protein